MRLREPFIVYPRTLDSGKKVFYYQAYDEKNRRIAPRSTGQTSKTRARLWCQEQLKAGTLIPEREEDRVPTLEEFGKEVWNPWHSEMVKYRRLRGLTLSKSHLENQLRSFTNRIIPGLGKYRLNELTTPMIEKWFLNFKDEGLSHQTCNHLLFNLRTILGEAVRQAKILVNPASGVKPLAKDAKERGILTSDEVVELLSSQDWNKRWPTWITYLATIVAASTGMRIGEIMALRWMDLFPENKPDRIVVRHNWDRKHGLKSTKTDKERIIPLSPLLKRLLNKFSVGKRPEHFIFSLDHGQTPMVDRMLVRAFYDALESIGIDEAVRKERNITFHGWRHFFNTYLRRTGIQDSKVQMVTGHATQEMTEHYTHFNILDLKEVEEAQSGLLKSIGDTLPRELLQQ